MKKIVLIAFFAVLANCNIFAQNQRNSLSLIIVEVLDNQIMFDGSQSCMKIEDSDFIVKNSEYEVFLAKLVVRPQKATEVTKTTKKTKVKKEEETALDFCWNSPAESKQHYKYFIMSPDIFIYDMFGVQHFIVRPFKGISLDELTTEILIKYELELRTAQISSRSR